LKRPAVGKCRLLKAGNFQAGFKCHTAQSIATIKTLWVNCFDGRRKRNGLKWHTICKGRFAKTRNRTARFER
jgi:hypothetical protein